MIFSNEIACCMKACSIILSVHAAAFYFLLNMKYREMFPQKKVTLSCCVLKVSLKKQYKLSRYSGLPERRVKRADRDNCDKENKLED